MLGALPPSCFINLLTLVGVEKQIDALVGVSRQACREGY